MDNSRASRAASGPGAHPANDVPGWGTLAFAALGGIAAWGLHLGLSYALIPFVCGTGRVGLLHLVTAGTGLVAALATGAGWWAWTRLAAVGDGHPHEGEDDGALGLRASIALFGIIVSGFFLVLILVEGVPVLLQGDPCRFIPSPDRPIVLLGWLPVLAGPPAACVRWGSRARVRWSACPPDAASSQRPRALRVLALTFIFLMAAPGELLAHGEWVGPAAAWSAWSWSPILIVGAAVLTGLYLVGVGRVWGRAGRGSAISGWRVASYLAGIGSLIVALLSPIRAISGALFSVHMIQHVILIVVAAPLIVLGRPVVAYLWGLPRPLRGRVARIRRVLRSAWPGHRLATHPVMVLLLYAAMLWAWHVPSLYQAALESHILHHLEHAGFLFTALLFWSSIDGAGHRRRWRSHGAGILLVFITALHSGALGALLLFSPEPWYPAHAAGTAAWGVDPLVDQQVAGAIMWIPPGIVYSVAIVVLLVAWLGDAERTTERREGRPDLRPVGI